eukprot:scaffold37308_cov49-Attheya_sp.AAC.2
MIHSNGDFATSIDDECNINMLKNTLHTVLFDSIQASIRFARRVVAAYSGGLRLYRSYCILYWVLVQYFSRGIDVSFLPRSGRSECFTTLKAMISISTDESTVHQGTTVSGDSEQEDSGIGGFAIFWKVFVLLLGLPKDSIHQHFYPIDNSPNIKTMRPTNNTTICSEQETDKRTA